MTRALLLSFLMLSACARGLTDNEVMFAKSLFGDTLDTDEVRVMAGLGVTPLPLPPKPDPAAVPGEVRKPPDDLCVRKPSPRRYYFTWPAAFVVNSDMFFSYRWYSPDAFAGVPDSVPFPGSVLMAHELVHVWQWQNRERTDYTPLKGGQESWADRDPYFFEAQAGAEFLSYGYEQQAAMVEDFVCYAFFDPHDPELDRIAGILRPFFTVDAFLESLGR